MTYYQKNREEILKKKKQYHLDNQEKILAKNKIRYEKSNKIIQIGEIFYKLTVINQAENEKTISSKGKQSSRRMWNVRCICKNEFVTSGTKLRRGDIVMCSSCANKLRPQSAIKFTGEEILFKRVILNRAIKSNIEVLLSVEDFVELVIENCYYCGTEPSERNYHNKRQISIKINGLDRIDSSKGYIKENCVPCCKICNIMKNNLEYNEFYEHIEKILKFREAKEGEQK